MATCTAALAEFARAQSFASLPPSVLQETKLMVLDGVGLALAAAREDFALKSLKALRLLGQGTDATVIGTQEKFPCGQCAAAQRDADSCLRFRRYASSPGYSQYLSSHAGGVGYS